MTRRKRRLFTNPLSTGRAPSMGSGDPRARRDNPARTESIASAASAAEQEALLQTISSLSSRVTALEGGGSGPATEESSFVVGSGDLVFDGSDLLYVSYPTSGALWLAYRWDGFTDSEYQGFGSRPTTLSQFQAIPWS